MSQEARESAAPPPDKTGRVLDVGEEKGHGSRRQRAALTGPSLDLTVHPLVLDGEGHRRGHRARELWIGENGAGVNQRRHRLTAALEQCHRAISTLRSEEHTSELQSQSNLVCRLLLEKKKTT